MEELNKDLQPENDRLGEQSCGCNLHGGRECGKLDVYDWLNDVVQNAPGNDLVEVRFKNTRKDYYQNCNGLSLVAGDLVAVEGSPGHDIGIVTLTGELVQSQIVKNRYRPRGEFKKIYRKAKPNDLEKWEEAIAMEHETMIRSRQIVKDLGLDMKIGDVEIQGDKTKGIFYYIAEGRVDFRELIKVLASNFRVRIEMKQIGARQEAGRIGGIGPCGRELCCSSWLGNFKSVSTGAARTQEVSLNPQKLAGQCSKLKCCLNYELDAYDDARRDFPSGNIQLETEEGRFAFVKSDTFKRMLYYICITDRSVGGIKEISVDRAKEIIAMNRQGQKPEKLVAEDTGSKSSSGRYNDILSSDDESLTRFDRPAGSNRRKSNRNNRNNNNRRSNSSEGGANAEANKPTSPREQGERRSSKRRNAARRDNAPRAEQAGKNENGNAGEQRQQRPNNRRPNNRNRPPRKEKEE
ncbi:MAG: stage 0 sporulation family protein [Mangrovibacterium sp.]